MKYKYSITTFCLALAFASSAHAAVLNVITPTGVSFTDSTGTYASPGGINQLIDGSGISPTIGATVDTATLNSYSVSADIEGTGWRRNGPTAPSVDFTFTLASASSFNGILIANYWENGFANRGVSTFGLEISTNGGTTYTFAQTVNPAQSTGNVEYINLGTTYTGVTNIKFNDATYFSPGPGNELMGLNEVRFTIPEPSAALLGGLGMLCLLRRRRA